MRVIDFDPPDADDSSFVANRDQLERGFRRLKVEQRTLVVLRYYLGLSLPELAEALSLPLGTTNSPIWLMSLSPGVDVVVENVGDEPAVLYQLIVEPVTGSEAPESPLGAALAID